MFYLLATAYPSINWLMKRSDPVYFDLPILPGWSLVNPLYYHSMRGLPPIYHQNQGVFVPEGDDQYTIATPFVVFRIPFFYNEVVLELFNNEKFGLFLRRLRLLSCQALMPETFGGVGPFESPDLEIERNFVERVVFDFNHSHEYSTVGTAVTAEMCIKAGEGSAFDQTIWDAMFLDAMTHFVNGNFRSALLSAAITMESVAATTLEAFMETAKANRAAHPHLRFIEIPMANGGTVVKDPVYELLMNKDRFQELLHERALYVLGKSLMRENEPLYQMALKLYGSRNKIVHRGAIPEDAASAGRLFPPDRRGTQEAIETAISVTQWFGSGETYGRAFSQQ